MSQPIGIMGAMPEEVADLASAIEGLQSVSRAGRRYARGRLFGHEVVLVHSLCGKVAAATTSTDLIAHFGVGEIIFTGVAGAVREDLRIGDVVVATELIQHDMNAEPLFPRYEIPLSGRSRHRTDPARRDRAIAAAEAFLAAEGAARLGTPADRPPRAVAGVIASGDRFFACGHEIGRLRTDLPDVAAVEMEGAAVAQVAHDFDVPLTVIRTISDAGDDGAGRDFSQSLQMLAAAWSHGILEAMFTNR